MVRNKDCDVTSWSFYIATLLSWRVISLFTYLVDTLLQRTVSKIDRYHVFMQPTYIRLMLLGEFTVAINQSFPGWYSGKTLDVQSYLSDGSLCWCAVSYS